MRTFRIQVNDASYTVSVEQTAKDKFQATLDDVEFEVTCTSNGDIATWLVKNVSEKIHAQTKNLPDDRVDVWLASTPFPARVQTVGIGGYAVAPQLQSKSVLASQVRALMPGRVTSILVKEDERVKEGAPLLILEAMKMQNEITSPSNGKIKRIFVHEGETVKKDSSLVSIE
jgi:biotin carboxyl carrier protein